MSQEYYDKNYEELAGNQLYLTPDPGGYVLYTEQDLNNDEKDQARTNIGAAAVSDVDDINSEISTIESNISTNSKKINDIEETINNKADKETVNNISTAVSGIQGSVESNTENINSINEDIDSINTDLNDIKNIVNVAAAKVHNIKSLSILDDNSAAINVVKTNGESEIKFEADSNVPVILTNLAAGAKDTDAVTCGQLSSRISDIKADMVKFTNGGSELTDGTVTVKVLPDVTDANDGQFLTVSGGKWVAGTMSMPKVLSGTALPGPEIGNDGDFYIYLESDN